MPQPVTCGTLPPSQIFVINLAVSQDRLAFMSSQLPGGFHRIDAATGDALPPHLADQFETATGLTSGEKGCYASHLIAAEQIIARGLPYALILEDDVQLDDGILEDVAVAIGAAPQAWDVIGLAWWAQPRHRKLAPVGRRHLVQFLHMPKVTAAYVLSYSGAQKLLAPRQRVRPVDVDIHYAWEMRINGYGIHPQPARQAHLPSTIGTRSNRHKSRRWRPPLHRYLWGRSLMALKMIAPKRLRSGANWRVGGRSLRTRNRAFRLIRREAEAAHTPASITGDRVRPSAQR